jgi:hypothetical protein
VVGAGLLVLLGGGVSEDVSYALFQERAEPRSWWRRVFGG